MKKTYLYTAIVTALFVTNISTVNAETAKFQLKADLKKEIKSNIPNAQTPLIKVPETDLSHVIDQVPDGVEDAAQGARDKAIADQSDLTSGLDTGSSLRDPNTGGNLAVGPSSRLKDPRSGNSMSGGRPSVATDPRTGKSLMGGSNGDSSASNRDGARAAASAGRGMASDDTSNLFRVITGSYSEHNNDTEEERANKNNTDLTFVTFIPNRKKPTSITVYYYEKKGKDGHRPLVFQTTYNKDGTRTTQGEITQEDEKKAMAALKRATEERKKREAEQKKKEETESKKKTEKPAPDGSYSGTTNRPLTQVERQEVKNRKLLLQGRGSYEDDGRDDQPASNKPLLTDLDLAGHPSPDGDNVGGAAVTGNIQDGALIMTGQPTEEDDNFGAVGGRFSGSGIGNKNISDKLKQNTVSGVNQYIDVPKGGK